MVFNIMILFLSLIGSMVLGAQVSEANDVAWAYCDGNNQAYWDAAMTARNPDRDEVCSGLPKASDPRIHKKYDSYSLCAAVNFAYCSTYGSYKNRVFDIPNSVPWGSWYPVSVNPSTYIRCQCDSYGH